MKGGVAPRDLEEMLSGLDDVTARVLRLIWEQETDDAPDGLEHLAGEVRRVVAGLGLPPIDLLEELRRRWPDVAGRQWASRASPIVVRHGELLVEAADRRIVRWLRYDTERLVERIAAQFGAGFVTGVRVVGPTWRSS